MKPAKNKTSTTLTIVLPYVGADRQTPYWARGEDQIDWNKAEVARYTVALHRGGGRANQYAKIQRAYAIENAPDQVQLHHCEQYEDPASRKLDDVPLPEGLTYEEYFEYAYVNVSEHRFCHLHAVPWLRNLFRIDG